MPDFNINNLIAGHVLPVLPGKLAALQLQSKKSNVAEVPAGVEVGTDVDAGDPDLNNAPVLYNQQQVEALRYSQFGTPMVQPLEMRIDGEPDWWLLPIEPIISLSGGNVNARRTVAKSKYRGPITERWSQDAYSISIDGIFRGSNQYTYPEADVKKLRNICESRKVTFVRCPLFQTFNINQIVIDKYDFPFTKGEDMQVYRLSVFSDDQFQLLIELE